MGVGLGFLSELLHEDFKIKQILESEENKETEDDKFNRVDILVENKNGELVIVEIQNTREAGYFQRMLYDTAKVIVEHITEGQPYSRVKKVYSVNIVYFDTVYLSHSIRSYSTALINLLSFQVHHTHSVERSCRPRSMGYSIAPFRFGGWLFGPQNTSVLR